jgi:hypothetical protein
MKTRSLLALLALGAAACAGAPTVPAGVPTGAPGPARPPNCPLELLYTLPERPYVALGHKQNHVMAVPAGGAPETLRPWACGLGADAVIVERNQVLNMFDQALVEGTAIRWVVVPVELLVPPAPAPAGPEPRAIIDGR